MEDRSKEELLKEIEILKKCLTTEQELNRKLNERLLIYELGE